MPLATLLLIAAIICFALAAIGITVPRLNLVALGLALGFASFLVGGGRL
ncbi:MAG: hypothetical protein HY689_15910 [Chloroflexi bacterium]|nr:hypothetical protein [Chloroflexota bacterium]